ncbi:MAG: peptide-methionine (S)-S-oxide reductase MsrA [Gammaproteobacteria bacterium]|nr:peptide-methionine (S)-S-oxide reductase MsrA [Gammaproteobacteria bacterium]
MRILFKNFRWTLLALALLIIGSWLIAGKMDVSADEGNNTATAVFAGGCFWCMEPPFDKLEGVIATTSGYTGGHTDKPTYKQVSSDTTGHYEAVEITYDPNKIDYATLLNVFWHNVDPLDAKGQFCDKGKSYRTAIFYNSYEQKELAQASKKELVDSGYFNEDVVTAIEAAKTFYPAEDYHQNYYQKNPVRYKYYRFACGRDARLEELWKDSAGKDGSLFPQ